MSGADADGTPSQAYLLLENAKKSNNLGPLLRCAAAYGISNVLAVGFSKCSVEGSHGAAKYIDIVAFPTVEQAIASLQEKEKSVSIVGILGGLPIISSETTTKMARDSLAVYEDRVTGCVQIFSENSYLHEKSSIMESHSYPISSRPFDKDKDHCFVLCKQKRGLTLSLARVCEKFIHVPHIDIGEEPADNRALLDIQSCLSITLHHFSEWAGRDERTFEGSKFQWNRTYLDRDAIQNHLIREERRRERDIASQEARNYFIGFYGDGDY